MAIIGGFFSTDIKPDVQAPLTILKTCGAELTQLTRGILIGQVSTFPNTDQKWVFHSLDAVVPALKNLRQRLVTVKHEIKMIYPAFVDAEAFEVPVLNQMVAEMGTLPRTFGGPPPKKRNEASTDEELIELLKQALNTPQMKSTLVSLIAMANQATEAANGEQPGKPAEKQVSAPPRQTSPVTNRLSSREIRTPSDSVTTGVEAAHRNPYSAVSTQRRPPDRRRRTASPRPEAHSRCPGDVDAWAIWTAPDPAPTRTAWPSVSAAGEELTISSDPLKSSQAAGSPCRDGRACFFSTSTNKPCRTPSLTGVHTALPSATRITAG